MNWDYAQSAIAVELAPTQDYVPLYVRPGVIWLFKGGWMVARIVCRRVTGEGGAPNRELWQAELPGGQVEGQAPLMDQAVSLAAHAAERAERARVAEEVMP